MQDLLRNPFKYRSLLEILSSIDTDSIRYAVAALMFDDKVTPFVYMACMINDTVDVIVLTVLRCTGCMTKVHWELQPVNDNYKS